MSQACIFIPPEAGSASAEQEVVRVRDGAVQRLSLTEALAEIGEGWQLVLPVEAVTACAVQLPTTKGRWMRQALPFAVEELLADDVEAMHLALGEVLADGRHRVFAVQRDWLAGWLALCEAQPPAAIRVDADLLPASGIQLLWSEGRWLLGGEVAARLALSDEDCRALCASFDELPQVHADEAVELPVAEAERQPLDNPHLWLAGQSGGCNLAQGEFAPRHAGGDWQRWTPLLGAVAICLLLQWIFLLVQGWYLEREADQFRTASEQLYRELFPQDSRLINLRAQFDQHLASGGAGAQGRLLSVLGQASEALQDEAGVQIQQLDFSDSHGDLSLQVRAPGFDGLERLRERLSESGLNVELGSACREANGVSARVVIGG